ncbi:unnamed protein product, partial [Oppiella nova]
MNRSLAPNGQKRESTDNGANYNPPKHLLEALKSVANDNSSLEIHQKTGHKGHPSLRKALAYFYSILMNRTIDVNKEILVTAGALHGIHITAKSYLNPGDEVIIFEPFFMRFKSVIDLSGGVSVYVPLRTLSGQRAIESNDLTFDRKELESKFTNRTKMIWLNNPNNPTGKMFTEEELLFIGQLCEKYDVLIMSDEVSQFHYYEGHHHTRIGDIYMNYADILIDSNGEQWGKLFVNNGWRIGWVIGPDRLLWSLRVSLITSIAAVPTPTQIAFAIGLEIENQRLNTNQSFYNWLKNDTLFKRNRFLQILNGTGIDVIKPNSGYFIVANFTNVINKVDLSSQKDERPGFQLPYWLLKHKGNNIELYQNIMKYYGIDEFNFEPAFNETNLYHPSPANTSADEDTLQFNKQNFLGTIMVFVGVVSVIFELIGLIGAICENLVITLTILI